MVVEFTGEDGRPRTFDVGALPLPGWHTSLAESWAARVGPAGALRTGASASSAWHSLVRMIRFLAQTLHTPKSPENLLSQHVDTYRRFRTASAGEHAAVLELRSVALTFGVPPLSNRIAADVLDRMRPRQRNRLTPRSGYSDRELVRLVSAARADVAALRERLAHPIPFTDSEEERLANAALSTGVVPLGQHVPAIHAAKSQVADRLFVRRSDLIPMMVLLVATTGWNIEVIKDLPSEHRVIDGLAVEVELTKRRRGPGRWHCTATWEIGPPGKELHTPGGVYLLLHKLMAPARDLLDEPAFWAAWHLNGRLGEGCRNPFALSLNTSLKNHTWVAQHDLLADSPPSEHDAADVATPLELNFNRLKTSVDVRRTKQMGGHLPSAARSNTTSVLFRNYLSGDHTTIEWANDVLAETLAEVEQEAWMSHQRALNRNGGTPLHVETAVSPTDAVAGSAAPYTETPWAKCKDHEHHPRTGRRCAVSFLDCFHCGNCVITGDNLPALLGLLDALEGRRQQMSADSWWANYGPKWAAIRYEVLPKFSEAEVENAHLHKPTDSLLDLVEPNWEQP